MSILLYYTKSNNFSNKEKVICIIIKLKSFVLKIFKIYTFIVFSWFFFFLVQNIWLYLFMILIWILYDVCV